MEAIPKKGHHIFNNALLNVLKDPIERFETYLKPRVKKLTIPTMAQDLKENPIGDAILMDHWQQKMTVHFTKQEENEKQNRFGVIITQLKENIYCCMVALWNGTDDVVHYERLIREFVKEMIEEELYVDEDALKEWKGSKQKVDEVQMAAKKFVQSLCYINNAKKNTVIPEVVTAFREANTAEA